VTTTGSHESEQRLSGGSVSKEMDLFIRGFLRLFEDHAVEASSRLGPGPTDAESKLAMARAVLETFKEIGTDFESTVELFARAAVESPPAQASRGLARGARKARVTRTPHKRGADLQWSEAKNARRCELIDRKIQNKISAKEAAELDDLQEAVRAHLDRVAPLPMEGARKLHAELLHRGKKAVK
jgi:hypothetical protein